MGQSASIKARFISSYVVAFLMVVGATVCTHLMVNMRLQNEQASAEIVNVSGAQRMLSQRAFALAESLTHDHDDRLAQEFMSETLSSFAQSHARLSQYVMSSQFPPGIQEQLDELFFDPDNGIDTMVLEYSALANIALERPLTEVELDRMEALALGELINALHSAVNLFQADAESGLANVNHIAMIGVAVIVLILLLEAIFIFFPLMKSLLAKMATEQEAREKAEIALDMEKAALESKERLMATVHGEFVGPLEQAQEVLESIENSIPETNGENYRISRALTSIKEAHDKASFMIHFYSKWKSEKSDEDNNQQESNIAA